MAALHKTLCESHRLYRQNCCFDSVPDDVEADLKSDMKDRVCVQWYVVDCLKTRKVQETYASYTNNRYKTNNSKNEDEIGLFALLGPTSSSDESRPELIHRVMSLSAVRSAHEQFGTRLRVLQSPEMRTLMCDEDEEEEEYLSSLLSKALQYEFIPGVSGENLTSDLSFDDVEFVDSISSAMNTSRGVDIRNASLCNLFRGILL